MNKRMWLIAGLAVFLAASCGKLDPITPPKPSGGTADFSVYVAMGTSLAAGYESGGLVERHQRHSYTYLFARQVQTPFTIPSISDSGIAPLLILRSLSPLLITRAATQGVPTNLAQPTPYHNLGIPGALLADALDASLYGRSPMFNIILRGQGTVLQQALSLSPTFLSFEYGANEVLSAATEGSGTLLSPAFDPPSFAAMYTVAMNAIAVGAPNAKLVLFNVPNVTAIPFFTTLSPLIHLPNGGTVPLIGPDGDLASTDLVLLTAADSLAMGTGIPVILGGNGRPLLDRQVLSTSEQASIQGVITAYNAIIDSVATGRGHALVDLNALLDQVADDGKVVQGTVYSEDFITGGVFSLDGVHPTDLGYGIMAGAMIDAVNAKFGTNIPPVDMGYAATIGGYRAKPPPGPYAQRPTVRHLDAVLRDLYGRGRAPAP